MSESSDADDELKVKNEPQASGASNHDEESRQDETDYDEDDGVFEVDDDEQTCSDWDSDT